MADTPVEFLLQGQSSREAIRHLLHGCADCLKAMRSAMGSGEPSEFEPAVDAALKTMATATARASLERSLTPYLVDRLLEHPLGRSLTLVRSSWRFHSPAIVQELGRRSLRLLSISPARGLEVARLGLESANRLDRGVYGEALKMDSMGEARISVALALRRNSRFREAEIELGRAADLLQAGSGDSRALAFLFEQRGELYCRVDRTKCARTEIGMASRIHHEDHRYHDLGKTMARLGRTWTEESDPYREGKALILALELVDPAQDGRLVFVIAHNLLESLLEAGQCDRAMSVIRVASPLYSMFAGPAERVTLRWSEARVLAASGRLRRAIMSFKNATTGFVELGMPVEAALCALEGALAHLRLGELDEVRKVAEEVLPTFQSRRLGPEVLAARALLQESLR